MFSEATVLAVHNDRKLTVLSKGSDAEVKLGANHLTRFPPDFDLHESETEQEEKPAESPPLPNRTSTRITNPQRHLSFLFSKTQEADRPDVQPLSNDDFTELADPEKAPERMQIEPGTALLDALADQISLVRKCSPT
jgi:hypothetical protein